ncbi:hypothetical protein COCNU_09G008150 [Cocos nucifera]|uniref:Uncharacterized protein n=1 Tax=Cocos nucifera TaxID=13894 RepID=A0A8K0N713_COCNU|nr:hypothetical protein COCNU_09G008150 [Cocos nucifera]
MELGYGFRGWKELFAIANMVCIAIPITLQIQTFISIAASIRNANRNPHRGHKSMIRVLEEFIRNSLITGEQWVFYWFMMSLMSLLSTTLDIRNWIRQIEQHASDNVNKILVGNKADMDESKRAVSTSQGQMLADEYGIKFFETSAKTNFNVEQVFFSIAREIKQRLVESDSKAEELEGHSHNLKTTVILAPSQKNHLEGAFSDHKGRHEEKYITWSGALEPLLMVNHRCQHHVPDVCMVFLSGQQHQIAAFQIPILMYIDLPASLRISAQLVP